MFQRGIGMHKVRRNIARIADARRSSVENQQETGQRPGDPRHATPPARSAFEAFGPVPEPRPSMRLYHEISHATPVMTDMPNALSNICIPTDRETSDVIK